MFHHLRLLLYLTFTLIACAGLPLAGVVKAESPQTQPVLTYYMPGSKDPLPPSTFGKSRVPAAQTTPFVFRLPQAPLWELPPAPVSPPTSSGSQFGGGGFQFAGGGFQFGGGGGF